MPDRVLLSDVSTSDSGVMVSSSHSVYPAVLLLAWIVGPEVVSSFAATGPVTLRRSALRASDSPNEETKTVYIASTGSRKAFGSARSSRVPVWVCTSCQAEYIRWLGRCTQCQVRSRLLCLMCVGMCSVHERFRPHPSGMEHDPAVRGVKGDAIAQGYVAVLVV
jgi:hypothetical protein